MDFNRRGRSNRTRGRGRGGRSGRRNQQQKINKIKAGKIGRIVPLGYNFQPPRLEDIIRYSDTFITAVAAGGFVEQLYRLNSVYDPDFTGIGRVGYGYEQLSKLYNCYLVIKCRWTIEIAGANFPMVYCVVPVNGNTTFTDIEFPSECPFSKKGTTSYNGSVPFRDNRAKNLWTLTGVSLDKYLSDDQYRGVIGTNPAEGMYLHVCSYNPNTSAINRTVSVKLEYTTIWYDPILPTPLSRKTVKQINEETDREKYISTLEEKLQQQQKQIEQLMSMLTVDEDDTDTSNQSRDEPKNQIKNEEEKI
jgi:hypothetical protein